MVGNSFARGAIGRNAMWLLTVTGGGGGAAFGVARRLGDERQAWDLAAEPVPTVS